MRRIEKREKHNFNSNEEKEQEVLPYDFIIVSSPLFTRDYGLLIKSHDVKDN